VQRAANVVAIPKHVASRPAPLPDPGVLLVGNSHTYALPGLHRGETLRPDPGATLIDDLAADVEALRPGKRDAFYRLSYPNMLPYEMLIRVADLLEHGYAPRVVVLGLTWRNLARDTAMRWEVRDALRDRAFAQRLGADLAGVAAAPSVLEALAADERLVAEDQAKDRSYADRLDGELFDVLAERVALVGRAVYVRADVQGEISQWLADRFVKSTETQYASVPADLAFNLDCLRALVALLRARGVTVLGYLAPERSDVAPLIDATGEDDAFAALEAAGLPLVDARHVVADELWGWERGTPDRSHFTEPGHAALARFLAGEGATRKIWDALDRDR
jgi:hypothetical protein